MEYTELIKLRHSCRSYTNEPISKEILDDILEAGRIAPSAQNKQPWRYIVVDDKETIRKIAFHSMVGMTNFFIKDAPILIIACADADTSLRFNAQEYYLVDVAISFHQMMLAAWNHGIGSCWLAAFSEGELKKIFSLPANIRIVGFSPFGYPKQAGMYAKFVGLVAHSSKRKDISEILLDKKEGQNDQKTSH